MAIHVEPGLARKNADIIKRSIQDHNENLRKRQADGSKSLADACHEASGYLVRRAKGKKYYF